MNFLKRIKQQFNSRENYRGQSYDKVTVDRSALTELVHHFESMDTALRADNTPAQTSNRTHALVLEVEAMFHGSGAEETMDIVMFTIAEIRKREIKADKEHVNARRIVGRIVTDSPEFIVTLDKG